jgi:hypothetical protein
MMIGRHKLTERQRMTVDSAQAQVMTSQIDPFLKHIFHTLSTKQTIRDSDVRHATCAALVKLGATRE